MKTKFLRHLSGIIPAIALFTTVSAQADKNEPQPGTINLFQQQEKVNPPDTSGTYPPGINPRVLKDFMKNFEHAGPANWFIIKDGFAAKFDSNGKKVTVFYTRRGNWIATIHSYSQDKLPDDIRKMLKSTYYDYTIDRVDEITVEDKTAYLILIEDTETIKTIRITDEEMDVYRALIKVS